MNIKKKLPYKEPALMVVCIASENVIAGSGDAPEVHTSSEKASNDYDALVKSQNSNSIWDENW